MTDNLDKETRHYNMTRIKSINTAPEIIVRKFLFSKGFRFRINDKRFHGKPDIVLPKYRTVIFVHGCFWHSHNCKKFVLPKSNVTYWSEKLNRNKTRDEVNICKLKNEGWQVLVVWECELEKKNRMQKLEELALDLYSLK
ncbi:DNA mismatch endonuclease Vsr [Synergistaceae bacterium OttesenSCG-928-D05]|nr:DNA mismatch endonuclease Vsr [Synergistaceae bacterium OttesenSCG-928-D05]